MSDTTPGGDSDLRDALEAAVYQAMTDNGDAHGWSWVAHELFPFITEREARAAREARLADADAWDAITPVTSGTASPIAAWLRARAAGGTP